MWLALRCTIIESQNEIHIKIDIINFQMLKEKLKTHSVLKKSIRTIFIKISPVIFEISEKRNSVLYII